MTKILFVCHGNICRSPMAECILKDKIEKENLDIYVESRATSFEEINNDIYPPAKKVLDKHNIFYDKHHAKRINQKDYDEFDYIYVMDSNNMRSINKIVDDKKRKIRMLSNHDIEDPWYTGNYEKVYQEITSSIDQDLIMLTYLKECY